MKSENEIKFENVSRDFNLFGRITLLTFVHLFTHFDYAGARRYRIPYDFKFYVRYSTSDDVFSLFVMFFLRELFDIYNEKCPFALSN